MNPPDYAAARRALMRRDPVLAGIIRQHGPCGLGAARDRFDHFAMLVRAIVFQQLSTKAATTIHNRLLECTPEGLPLAQALATLSEEQLRTAGISRQKAGYLRDLCERVRAGDLDLESVDSMTDDEVIAALTRVKGIGRWTAEMFLIFRLQRPDVLPFGDLGIVTAIQRAYRLRKKPTLDRMRKIGEPWRPYRSVASWYLWRSLEPPSPRVRRSSPAPASRIPRPASREEKTSR
ncbi:MAG: DNA-3-methyladenine glycosylase 2 family protein [Acidobacteria bacterium]|nr:DNA-3-methyladenine glycosylase 2 family protein [Acidobacteriota bacterium]